MKFFFQRKLFHRGRGHYGPSYHETICCYHKVIGITIKIPDSVHFDTCQFPESQSWCSFFKKLKNWMLKMYRGAQALGKIRKKSEIFYSFTNKPYCFKLNLNVLGFHLRCITPLKLKILKKFECFVIISTKICHSIN